MQLRNDVTINMGLVAERKLTCHYIDFYLFIEGHVSAERVI